MRCLLLVFYTVWNNCLGKARVARCFVLRRHLAVTRSRVVTHLRTVESGESRSTSDNANNTPTTTTKLMKVEQERPPSPEIWFKTDVNYFYVIRQKNVCSFRNRTNGYPKRFTVVNKVKQDLKFAAIQWNGPAGSASLSTDRETQRTAMGTGV